MSYTMTQLEDALVKLHGAGEMDKARKIAAVIKRERERRSSDSGTLLDRSVTGQEPIVPETIIPQDDPDSSIGQQILGAGETALSLGTAATTGLLSGAGGAMGQAMQEIRSGKFGAQEAAQRIEQAAVEGMQRGTYAPRTEAGQEMIGGIAEATEFLGALPPVMAEANLLTGAARQAAGVAPATISKVWQGGVKAVDKAVETAKKLYPEKSSTLDKSIGAAEVAKETVRRAEASDLMVPIKLTKGEASRDFDQLRFEKETAKLEAGKPLRDRVAENNLLFQQNFDAMIDDMGAIFSEDPASIGKSVTEALESELGRTKNKVKYKYKLAEKKGAMEEPVQMMPLAEFLNENRAERLEFGIMDQLQNKLNVMEVSQGDFKTGDLAIGKITTGQAEDLIQFINRNTDKKDGREVYMAGKLKNVIDSMTGEVANKYYKDARSARVEQWQRFESMKLIRNLLGTQKRTEDRVIALEDVLKKSVLQQSADAESLKFLKKTLLNSGEKGWQAWKELQGGTVAYIRDKSFTTATDQASNPYISAAKLENTLTPLFKSGKADILFDSKIKNNLRLLMDVSKYVSTAPPGIVNNSNTATVLSFLADMALLGTAGVPVPVVTAAKAMSSQIKDQKLKKRMLEALK